MLKYNVRPKYGLTIRILREFMSEEEIVQLVDKYMEAKKKIVLRELDQKREEVEKS